MAAQPATFTSCESRISSFAMIFSLFVTKHGSAAGRNKQLFYIHMGLAVILRETSDDSGAVPRCRKTLHKGIAVFRRHTQQQSAGHLRVKAKRAPHLIGAVGKLQTVTSELPVFLVAGRIPAILRQAGCQGDHRNAKGLRVQPLPGITGSGCPPGQSVRCRKPCW